MALEDPAALRDFAARLLPLPRSLTGDGVRATLAAVAAELGDPAALAVHEVPTGSPALDWTVPQEWRLRRAWLTAPDGTVVADSAEQPLAVVGYSVAVDAELSLEELAPHLHSLPEQPDAVPYRTSYYARDWGFCLSHRLREALVPGRYRARVDAALVDGTMTYGELVLGGHEPGVVLISTHLCHPGMANDNASGLVVATALAARLAQRQRRRFTYRIVFAPGTIGALAWLEANRAAAPEVVAGLVLAGVGDRGPLTYKRSRRGDAAVDRAAAVVLRSREGATLVDFTPWGYDERQYGSPGFDLPVGLLMRTPHGTYAEYHTSLDSLDFITGDALAGALEAALEILEVLEHDGTWRNLAPYGEPQLGRRGLYPATGGRSASEQQLALLWVLNQSDGTRSLLSVAERSGLPFAALRSAAERLHAGGLLEPA